MRRVQYVTFSVEVTARVDAELDGSDCWNVVEVSGIGIDGLDQPLLEYIEELAAEVALEKGEWHV